VIDYCPGDDPSDFPAIPVDPAVPFEIIESVIERIVDQNSFIELYRDMNDTVSGPTLVTGLGRLKGTSVGIIADQPLILGGGADAPGTEKFRIFTRFCNRNNLPILMLSNSSGFVPGVKQERLRIQAIGADSLDENILGRVPVVSVVLRQNFGGRQIQAFNRFLRPGIVYLALKDATLAVMGAEVAFDLLKGKTYRQIQRNNGREKAEEFRSTFIREYNENARAQNDALDTGCVDRIIEGPEKLREEIISGLGLARERAAQAFGE
jgi:acetyl-CoA carboxylase carboxyltransferase component